MTDPRFDHPEMRPVGGTAQNLPESPDPGDFSKPPTTAADLVSGEDLPRGVGHAPIVPPRAVSGVVSPHAGGAKVNPGDLPDSYVTPGMKARAPKVFAGGAVAVAGEAPPQSPGSADAYAARVAAIQAGRTQVEEVPLDGLSTDEQIQVLRDELRQVRRQSASGGAYADCEHCKGSGKVPWVKPGTRGGYIHKGEPVMARCPECFPGGSGEPMMNA